GANKMPFTIITQGQFTSAGVGVKIPMPSSADYFFTRNLTQLATTNATGRVVMGEWFLSSAIGANDGIRYKKTNSTNALNVDFFSTSTASNGFTYVPVVPFTEAAVTGGTSITQANGAVVTITNTYS